MQVHHETECVLNAAAYDIAGRGVLPNQEYCRIYDQAEVSMTAPHGGAPPQLLARVADNEPLSPARSHYIQQTYLTPTSATTTPHHMDRQQDDVLLGKAHTFVANRPDVPDILRQPAASQLQKACSPQDRYDYKVYASTHHAYWFTVYKDALPHATL